MDKNDNSTFLNELKAAVFPVRARSGASDFPDINVKFARSKNPTFQITDQSRMFYLLIYLCFYLVFFFCFVFFYPSTPLTPELGRRDYSVIRRD